MICQSLKKFGNHFIMSEGIAMTASALKESLSNLSEDPSKARALSILMLLKDLLNSTGEVADVCADTGDCMSSNYKCPLVL
jgi:hypothetical protein